MNHHRTLFIIMMSFMMLNSSYLSAQETEYFPNGDPDQWQVSLTPYLWLPWISGEMESSWIEKEFNVPDSDILKNLKMAFMINAEVSKGEFFASPGWVYTKLGTEKLIKEGPQGNNSISAEPELKMNIVTFIAGMHSYLDDKFILDPYLGFRYNNFKTTIDVSGIADTTSIEEKATFWDPVLGLRALYFPHPRVPVMMRFDVGGFGAGSDFSWTALINGGYSVSPTVDLTLGFTAYGTDFSGETKTGSIAGLNMVMYGINMGAKFYLPTRYKDPTVFKKSKK